MLKGLIQVARVSGRNGNKLSGFFPLYNIAMTGQPLSCRKTASSFQVLLIIVSATLSLLIFPPFFPLSPLLPHHFCKDSIREASTRSVIHKCGSKWGRKCPTGEQKNREGSLGAQAELNRLKLEGKSEDGHIKVPL